jgi:hypothetical protein
MFFFYFFVIFGVFGRFRGKVLEAFLCGVCVGNNTSHEVGVPLFLVILPLKSRGKAFDFRGFHVLGVLEVEAQYLRFLLF